MEVLRTPTVHVVATTAEGTDAALTVAGSLARALAKEQEARIVLVIPQVGADGGPPDPSMAATNWLVAHYELVARRLGQTVQLSCCECTCADPLEAAKRLTPVHGTIVIGGPALWWWPSAEERLAARLRRSGREVVFVGCNGRRLEQLASSSQ